jgi:hypothetical protein
MSAARMTANPILATGGICGGGTRYYGARLITGAKLGMGEEEDYADDDLPPPFQLRLSEHRVSLLVGVVFLSVICGGTSLVFLLTRFR